ncbi:hypothetical protein ACP4OV_017305 [Aristida adscensionis]
MAQQAVFPVLERVGSIAVDEAIYLWGVSDKVESAKKQLLRMKAFLKDLDDKMLKGGAMARNLLSEVREVAYEVEDIIDTANIMKRKSNPKISIPGAISKYVVFPIYLTHLHKLGARIDSANARMNTIFENFQKFNIVATAIAEEPQGYITEDTAIKQCRSVHPDFGEQIDVIGFDEQIKNIKSDLLDKRNRDLTVLSIIGPGGAGKSTMAKKVYGLPAIKEHFEAHAWITVSQRFVPCDLLKEMVRKLVPRDILEMVIKLTTEDEKAELEAFVPSDLIEEVLQRIMEKAKEAKKATMLRLLPRSHLEERMKHAIKDWKAKESEEAEEVIYLLEELIKRTMKEESAEEAKVKEVEGLEKLVPHHLLEQVLQRIIEEKKATQAEKANRSIELHRLKEKIKHAMEDFKYKEYKEAELKYPLKELIKHTIEYYKAEEPKEIEVKYLLEELIRRPMEHRKAKLDELKQEQLMKLLHKFAKSKRYLIVLDDIWSTNAWDIIRAALPDEKNGSRVVFTTRNEAVAHHPNARTKIYKPKLLNEEESTQLLLSTALPEYRLGGSSKKNTAAAGQNLERLKELGKDLALKCSGLPLAIVVLGGHLSKKPDVNEWKRLTSSMNWQALIADDRIIGGILDLSYYDMPSNLRSCFMYTTAFPEDSSIEVQVLASLWIAEGFIPLVRGHTRREVAGRYVAELIQRCMIQVEERHFSGRIMMIKVHDILRDWGIGRARREGFVKDCYGAEDLEASYSEEMMEAYRVVLHGKLTRKTEAPKRWLCTILDFKFSYTDVMANSLRAVRVLYIDSPDDVHIPKEIGLMSYLRYLGLGDKGRYYLPSSIGGLLSLETFHATGLVIHIPNSLWKIPTLSHVYACQVDNMSVPQIRSKSKLKVMLANRPYHGGWGNLGRYIEIQEKTIKNKSPGVSCCFAVSNMFHWCYVVGRCEGPQFPYHLSVIKGWDDVELLNISCQNLLRNDQDILELGRLLKLDSLELSNQSYTGQVITCPSGSFRELSYLSLCDLVVTEWKLGPYSMPRLRSLTIARCPNLKHLPEGLLWLRILKDLKLTAMPPSCYQEGTVAWELEKKGCRVHFSSNEDTN